MTCTCMRARRECPCRGRTSPTTHRGSAAAPPRALGFVSFVARTVPIFLLPLLLTSVTRSNVEGLSTFRASTPLAPRWRRVTDLFLASPMPPMPGVGGWTHSLNICNRAPWRPFARIEAPIGASPGASASRIAELRRLHVLVAGWVRTKGHDGHGWVAASVHFLCE